MIELKSDGLVVSFPEVNKDAVLTLNFQRTLRIPDDGRDYPLPPGLGPFPLRHLDDHAEHVPASWLKRGGVLLPMWQSEALWLHFSGHIVADRRTVYPFAVKVATGKISAITGESWRRGLSRNPQDYLVVPAQPWLDGYCVERGVIRQFVAMPLGQGYSVEEQLTGESELGGIQIEAFPMRREIFEKRFPVVPVRHEVQMWTDFMCIGSGERSAMGLAPGGRMRQEIYEDPFSIHDWDTEHGSRCFVHLVNSVGWQQITGTKPPSKPPTAQQYTQAGYPWFDYYDADAKALEGSEILAGVKSVKAKGQEKREFPLPDNQSLTITNIAELRAGLGRYQVREGAFD